MATAGTRVVLSATAAAATLAWWALRKLIRARRRRRFDGLDGIVSFSARLIAATRAAETRRADALFNDPLAVVLAGKQAMARLNAAEKEDAADRAPAAGGGAKEERLVPRLVLRTCFFDDATLLVTGQPQARAENVLQPVLAFQAAHPELKPCSQVVMLGAGMDARPWRLALGADIRWFEVDRQDVLAAKQSTLKHAGASFQGAAATSGINNNSSSSGAPAGTDRSKFPLHVGEWACASADLQQPGWVSKLLEAGLDPTQPTAWVAEGLLYYLTPSVVPAMLEEAAAVSAPGSMLICNFMTKSGLDLLHSSAAGRQATTGSGASEPQQLPPRELQRVGLLSAFKFGVPDDCESFFSMCGWQVLLRHGWKAASLAYGWQPLQNAPDKQRAAAQEVQMAIGVVKK